MMARARQLPGSTPAFDALLGIVAPSATSPSPGGRHKVWGSRAALGPAADVDDRQPPAEGDRAGVQPGPRAPAGRRDASCRATRSCVCSFGDASANHATALAAHQHRALRGAASACRADPLRLRGQRDRDQRADPARLDRGDLRVARRTCATSWPTARSTRSGRPRPRRSATSGAPASRHSCTSRRSASGATPVRDAEHVYRTAAEIARVEAPRPAAAQRPPPRRARRGDARRSCARSWPTPATGSWRAAEEATAGRG